MDVSSLELHGGITIEDGASLYFDWQKDISLVTKFIIIHGALYIGTENCPFERKVEIRLMDDSSLESMTLGMASVGRKVTIFFYRASNELGYCYWAEWYIGTSRSKRPIAKLDSIVQDCIPRSYGSFLGRFGCSRRRKQLASWRLFGSTFYRLYS